MGHTQGNPHNLSLHHERSPGHAVHHFANHQVVYTRYCNKDNQTIIATTWSELLWDLVTCTRQKSRHDDVGSRSVACDCFDVFDTNVSRLPNSKCRDLSRKASLLMLHAVAVGWRSDANQVVIDQPSLMCSAHVISVRKLNPAAKHLRFLLAKLRSVPSKLWSSAKCALWTVRLGLVSLMICLNARPQQKSHIKRVSGASQLQINSCNTFQMQSFQRMFRADYSTKDVQRIATPRGLTVALTQRNIVCQDRRGDSALLVDFFFRKDPIWTPTAVVA